MNKNMPVSKAISNQVYDLTDRKFPSKTVDILLKTPVDVQGPSI